MAFHKKVEKCLAGLFGINFCNGCDHDFPYKFEIDLTNNCHNNCKFCYYAASLETKKCEPDVDAVCSSVLSLLSEYSGAFEKKYGVEYRPMLYILGGEPLLYIDKCAEVVSRVGDRFSKILVISALPPNVARQYDSFKKLARMKNVCIDFSVLHSDEKLANELRNVPERKKYVNNLLTRMLNDPDLSDVVVGARVVLDPAVFKGPGDVAACVRGFEDMCSETRRKFSYIRFTELDDEPVDVVRLFGIEDQLRPAYSTGCAYDLRYGCSMPVVLKRKCFRECPAKRQAESFSDVVKFVYKLLRVALNGNKPYWIPMPIVKYDGRITNYRDERALRKKVCRSSR